jgi:TetR/AcrR family transcriptional regulator, transcriptional repressor for nem operon
MLGALTISRIVTDPKVSNEILAAARAKLSSWE